MSDLPLRYVIDASVGIKLFLVEPLSEKTDLLFAHLAAEQPAQFYVPDLFYVECTNILWKYTRRFGYAPEKAEQNIANLKLLALQSVPTFSLVKQAFGISSTYQISAYDACYVALANHLSIPCVTADERLVNKLYDSSHQVVWLNNLSIPDINLT